MQLLWTMRGPPSPSSGPSPAQPQVGLTVAEQHALPCLRVAAWPVVQDHAHSAETWLSSRSSVDTAPAGNCWTSPSGAVSTFPKEPSDASAFLLHADCFVRLCVPSPVPAPSQHVWHDATPLTLLTSSCTSPVTGSPPPGTSGVLRVTSAAGERNAFQQSSTTVPLSAACAASSCGAAATAAVASPAPAAATAAGVTGGTNGSAARSASSGVTTTVCPASSLGYTCSQTLSRGAVVHYSIGGAAPPDNVCTKGTAAVAAAQGQAANILHVALEGPDGVSVIAFGGEGELLRLSRNCTR